MPADKAAAQASDWLDLFPTATASKGAIRTALALSVAGQASYWDSLLLATAAEAGCAAILTEDMADGAVLHNLRIVNPFTAGGLSVEASVCWAGRGEAASASEQRNRPERKDRAHDHSGKNASDITRSRVQGQQSGNAVSGSPASLCASNRASP
jgi:hypothetical protein